MRIGNWRAGLAIAASLTMAACDPGNVVIDNPGEEAVGADEEAIIVNGPKFSLSAVSTTAAELPNPGRGFFRWRNVETAPVATYDAYQRYRWRDLEPSQDSYDFSRIDNDLAIAASKGQKFSFRIQAVAQGDGARQFPDYIPRACNSNGLDVPDWNSSYFIDRARRLFVRLAERYNNDSRISYIDMGVYGNWGEWHTGGLCGDKATLESKKQYVDLQVDAFTNKPLTMNSAASEVDAFLYALDKAPRVGVRCDSLGDPWFDDQFTRSSTKLAAVSERWKTAPFVAEFFGGSRTSFSTAAAQVKRWHVTMVGNGNVGTNGSWSYMSSSTHEAMMAVGKNAGYRLVLRELGFADAPVAGGFVSVVTRWSNLGVTPTYEPWNVSMQLRRSGVTAAELPLGVDFRKLLPTNGTGYDAPVERTDTVSVPSSLSGTYDVYLVVKSGGTRTAPLRLANNELQSDGSLKVGTVSVGVGTVPPPPPPPPAGTLSLVASGDSYVRDGTYHATNFGTESVLVVKDSGSGYERESYVQFDLSSVTTTVTSAKLKLSVVQLPDGAGVTFKVVPLTATFSESSLTWDNRPSASSTVLASMKVSATGPVTLDVSRQVLSTLAAGGKTVGFRIYSDAGEVRRVHFASKETGATLAPRLELQ